MNRRHVSRARGVQSPSSERLRLKLSILISRKEQLKKSFNHLKSQIRAGLLEVEDVFDSMAKPLMELVGMKTAEMASQGRFSTIVISTDHSHSQDGDVMDKARTAGNELIQRQKEQLMELINILKIVEQEVNSSWNSILGNLAHHQDYLRDFIQETATYVSKNQQSLSRTDLLGIIQKLLKTTSNLVGGLFESMEDGVNDLNRELSKHLCKPMFNYVTNMKKELKEGTSYSRLKEVFKEMEAAMIARNLELEKFKIESISSNSKLRETQAINRKLTLSLGLLNGDVIESEETLTQQPEASFGKELGLVRNKRKRQASPATSSRITRSQVRKEFRAQID